MLDHSSFLAFSSPCITLNWKHLDIVNWLSFYLICSSEFEELEAVPSLDVIEGPLEPPRSSAASLVPEVPDNSFVNFFSVSTFLLSVHVGELIINFTPVSWTFIKLNSILVKSGLENLMILCSVLDPLNSIWGCLSPPNWNTCMGSTPIPSLFLCDNPSCPLTHIDMHTKKWIRCLKQLIFFNF